MIFWSKSGCAAFGKHVQPNGSTKPQKQWHQAQKQCNARPKEERNVLKKMKGHDSPPIKASQRDVERNPHSHGKCIRDICRSKVKARFTFEIFLTNLATSNHLAHLTQVIRPRFEQLPFETRGTSVSNHRTESGFFWHYSTMFCMSTNFRYSPLFCISSSWVPVSATRPASKTMI